MDITKQALQALKDIEGAAVDNQPYNRKDLLNIISPILSEAYEQGIRLEGEE